MQGACEHVEVGTGNITLAGGDRTFPAEHYASVEDVQWGRGRRKLVMGGG